MAPGWGGEGQELGLVDCFIIWMLNSVTFKITYLSWTNHLTGKIRCVSSYTYRLYLDNIKKIKNPKDCSNPASSMGLSKNKQKDCNVNHLPTTTQLKTFQCLSVSLKIDQTFLWGLITLNIIWPCLSLQCHFLPFPSQNSSYFLNHL